MDGGGSTVPSAGDLQLIDYIYLFISATVDHWKPSKLLKALAENDVPIQQWAAYKKSISHL